jgi:hypothetical protein
MVRVFYTCFLICLLTALGARAQGIEFANGDHLSGKWLSVEGTTIEFRSAALGKVAIPVAKVASFTIGQPIVVVLQDGTAIPGDRARFSAGAWTVESHGGQRKIAAADVAAIVPAASYRSSVSEEKARPWRGWKGRATFGYSLQNGDQNARTVSIGVSAVRRQPNLAGLHERWRTNYAFNLLFANASSAGEQISSNSLTTSLRQDYFLHPHNFLFVLGQLDHIQAQNLYLRQTYGGGYGRDLLSSHGIRLSLLAGATFANEKFVGAPAEQFAEALVGEHATIQFNKKIQFDNSFTFYPNLTNRGDYRFDTSSALAFKLNSWLSANMGLTNFYLSRIPTGSDTTVTTIGPGGTVVTTTFPAHNNNITVTAGLGVDF